MDNGPTPKFVIEAAEAESLAAASHLHNLADLLPSLLASAQSLSRIPISKFPVATAGIGSDTGRIFLGVNVEFSGLPLHCTIHAEQFLIANLSLHSEPRLSTFAVSAAPCGHCRQFLQELRRAPDIQILIKNDGETDRFEPLASLLPRRFGPDDLLDVDMPLLLERRHNGLAFPNGVAVGGSEGLRAAALEAANDSHAPYSGCASGVAMVDRSGRVYKGSYMESAAYNPSLGPVQAAIVAYIVGGGEGYEEIVAAALVEEEGAAISQEETARMVFRGISPECVFEAFRCVSLKKKKNNTGDSLTVI